MSDQPQHPDPAAAPAAADRPLVPDAEPTPVGEDGAIPAVPGDDVLSAEDAQAQAAAQTGETAEAALAPDQGPDFQDLYLRARADTENLRKRAKRDVALASERGVAKLVKELLPAIDNLERALQATEQAEGEQSDHAFTKGIRLVQADLLSALTKVGVTVEDPKGQPFDPHRHEALAQAPVPGVEPGQVTEVYQPGYLLGETVIRPARVVVSG